MITISEQIPKKVSGRSSLFISFQYNEQIINTLKTFSPAVYDKNTKQWELPITCLSKLLDSLSTIDDITLQLLPEATESSVSKDFNKGLVLTLSEKKCDTGDHVSPCAMLTPQDFAEIKGNPFPHQVDAVNYGLSHNKWLLLDGCGLGKSAEMIWTAEALKRRGLVNHCLVICGVNSLKQNIAKEIEKFGNESYIILGEKKTKTGRITYGTVNERIEQLKEVINEFWIITNIESIRDDKFVQAFKKSKNKIDMICVDEIHRACGSSTSQQGKNLLKLDAPFKIGLTGTLIVNSPVSAYPSLKFIEADHATLTNFKSQYCEFGGFGGNQIVGYKNLDLLQDEIDHCSLRRTKDDLKGLPPKNITVEYIEMSEDHAKFYEAIKQGVKEEADKIELNSGNLLALTTRLRQATADPGILTTNDIMSSKLQRAFELAEDLVNQNEKVVIMSTYKAPIYKLAEMLKDYAPLVCTGDQSDSEVSSNVDRFQNDPNSKIFIGSTAKCATGLTLNAAAYMICLDTAWTSAMNNQCFDRIHRANNTRPAFIIVLICKDTIDERVWQISQFKQELSDYMIDHAENTQFTNTLRSLIQEL